MKQVDIYTLASTTGGERLDIYTVNPSNLVPPPVVAFYQQEANLDIYLTEGGDKYLQE